MRAAPPTLLAVLLMTGCAAPPPPPPPAPVAAAEPVAAAPADTQVWRGTMRCARLRSLPTLAVDEPITVTVTVDANNARFERARRDGVIERSVGTLDPVGLVTLTGVTRVGQYTVVSNYTGTLSPTRRSARLTGTQRWSGGHVRNLERPCTINLLR